MKTEFLKSFFFILVALLLLLLTAAGIFYLGLQGAIAVWDKAQLEEIENFARAYLLDLTAGLVPRNDTAPLAPLFIYTKTGELVYSNRGGGNRRRASSDVPLFQSESGRDNLLGYYATNPLHFKQDQANQKFTTALYHYFFLIILLSSALALGLALLLSRKLAAPARQLSTSLDQIAAGNLNIGLAEQGTKEIRLIARSVNKMTSRLAQEQEIRTQWAQDLAHDLRTPIAAVKAQLEGMIDGVLDLSSERLVRSLAEISRVEKLIHGLEELIKLESPEFIPQKTSFEFGPFWASIVKSFEPEIAARHLKFHTKPSDLILNADAYLLGRALGNLVSNAVLYTDIGGQICLKTRQSLGRLSLRLYNSGPGISREALPKLFDRLYRGEFSRHTAGSGLGLSIAKKIVELHEGSIEIKSLVGRGTLVKVLLGNRREI